MSTVDVRPGMITVSGELDLALTDHVSALGRQAVESCPGSVLVIDVSRVTFADSSGIGALLEVRSFAQRHHVEVVLRGASTGLVRVLEISGLRPYFQTLPSPVEQPAGRVD